LIYSNNGRFLCGTDASLVGEFERLLFPPMQAILQLDIPEFTPYVFQIISQLLEYHQNEIPALYQPLLPPLLQPVLWENSGNWKGCIDYTDCAGNVPALVRLLQAYLARGAQQIVAANQLPAFLGVFQKLIASRLNDHHGFELLTSITQNVPMYARATVSIDVP
jgi:exportin-2 (importin alpha re-exporter)